MKGMNNQKHLIKIRGKKIITWLPTCARHFITEDVTCVQNKAIVKVINLQHLSFWINPKY